MRHLEHANVLNLRIARLIVLRNARMDAFAAADTASQVEAIDELDAVHGLVVLHVRANLVLLLYLPRDAVEDFVHVRLRLFFLVLLKKLLGGTLVGEFAQRREAGGQRRDARSEHRGWAQETAAAHV